MPNLFKGTFVELSNLHRKFALSKNFDSWFTYCVLSQQIKFRFKLYFDFFDLKKFSAWESKIAASPPSFTTSIFVKMLSKNDACLTASGR